jgi:hypothetical protein
MYRRCYAWVENSKICLSDLQIFPLLLKRTSNLWGSRLIVSAERFIVRDVIIYWYNRRRLLFLIDSKSIVRIRWYLLLHLSLLLNDISFIYRKNLNFLVGIADILNFCIILPFWTQWHLLQVVIILMNYLTYWINFLWQFLKDYILSL